ncbi:hypothetical protein ACWDYH_08315 [Nocardia goodfellowii]|uniref:Uncharacterized protein n=1 Tax=Nocardia goodfellowii TaxID=882446 RepID=A0ABS4QIJ0_9NOCA|nr:hypothetical protein [Nocardia goodfellowii]MBP2191519.1 hypothetical protein [Nocardia goodfellowii]
MTVRTARTLTIGALALSTIALSAGNATAATPAATPVVGSVALCFSVPLGPASVSICL